MLFAQIVADAVDWSKVVLGIGTALLPVAIFYAQKNARLSLAFKLLQVAADKHEHGENWAQSAMETASAHSKEIGDLVSSAIPDKLLAGVDLSAPKPPAAPL